jgi:Ca2+-binding EF-hand superfamily protein
MNRLSLLVLALAATTASSAAFAQHRDHGAMRSHDRGHAAHARGFDGGIARLDANADGRIARTEIAQIEAAGQGRFAKHLGKDFAAIDANRDGFIVRTELQAWHERMKPQRMAKMQQRFDQRFVAADLNRDGKLSKVEAAEKMPRLQQRFAWMDDNRDGFLSRAELRPRH